MKCYQNQGLFDSQISVKAAERAEKELQLEMDKRQNFEREQVENEDLYLLLCSGCFAVTSTSEVYFLFMALHAQLYNTMKIT